MPMSKLLLETANDQLNITEICLFKADRNIILIDLLSSS